MKQVQCKWHCRVTAEHMQLKVHAVTHVGIFEVQCELFLACRCQASSSPWNMQVAGCNYYLHWLDQPMELGGLRGTNHRLRYAFVTSVSVLHAHIHLHVLEPNCT